MAKVTGHFFFYIMKDAVEYGKKMSGNGREVN